MSSKIGKAIDRKTLNIFVKLTKNRSKEKIKEEQEKFQRKLSREEKRKIIRNVAKRTRGRAVIISMFALGAISGMKTQNLLNSADEKGIQIEKTSDGKEAVVDLNEIDKVTIKGLEDLEKTEDTGIYVEQEKNGFLQSLKVDVNEITANENIRSEAEKEVNNLNNSDEVLAYMKEAYVKEYNEKHGTNITVDNLELYKGRGNTLYRDIAENGDEIIRSTSEKYVTEKTTIDPEIGIVTARIKDNDGKYISRESMTYDNGKYVTVYNKDQKVDKYSENTLAELKGITFNGIDYYGAFTDAEKNTYKSRFIDSVENYKKNQINEIANVESETNNKYEETR